MTNAHHAYRVTASSTKKTNTTR